MDKPQHVLPVWCRQYLDLRVVRNVVGVMDIGDHKMFEPHVIPASFWRTFRVKVRCSMRDAGTKNKSKRCDCPDSNRITWFSRVVRELDRFYTCHVDKYYVLECVSGTTMTDSIRERAFHGRHRDLPKIEETRVLSVWLHVRCQWLRRVENRWIDGASWRFGILFMRTLLRITSSDHEQPWAHYETTVSSSLHYSYQRLQFQVKVALLLQIFMLER